MTTPARIDQPDVDIYEPSTEQWQSARERALEELGMTYDELAEQARTRSFESARAHSAWVTFGDAQQ